ncbi:hypothetical protein AWENTII_010965 [Aspergillus wentii]|nr:hypothetical protein MW887_003497 [Aspergillus wentii]
MLSGLLASSYLQYKRDTDAVASWLATTAKKCGYSADLLVNNKGQQGPGKSKGKSRKPAKQAPSAQAYTIAVKDFISLADYIIGSKNARVDVTSTFVLAINRAISVRKTYGSQILSTLPRNDKTLASNERHSYFIGILEHVRDTLRPLIPKELLGEQEAPKRGADKLSSLFENLDVYEPSEEFLKPPDKPPVHDAKQYEPQYKAEEAEDFEEALLAFQLLLGDLNKIRSVVSQTWAGYKAGIFDVVTASVTSNTAIDIARRLEEDIQGLFQKHGGCARMIQMLYVAQCIVHGENANHKEKAGDDMNFRMYDVAEAIFWPTYELLNAFTPLIFGNNMPIYKTGHYGIYDPSQDRSKLSAREKFQEDKIIMMESLPEFYLLCKGCDFDVPAQDEFISGLQVMFKTKKIPMWLVLAAQVFLDVNHEFRGDVDRAFNDLQNVAGKMEASILGSLRFTSRVKIENWPRINDNAFRDVLARINEWVKNDPMQVAKSRLRRPLGEPFMIMKRHPTFTGLWVYTLKSLFQDIGITLANAYGSVLYTGYLYNAVLQEKLLTKEWKDMELLITLHDNFFVGDRPETPEESLKRFVLSMGGSVSEFSKNKRGRGGHNAPALSRKGPRGLTPRAPVSLMFMDRFCHGSRRSDLSVQDLEEILSKGMWEEIPEETADAKKKERSGDDSDVRVFGRSRPMTRK